MSFYGWIFFVFLGGPLFSVEAETTSDKLISPILSSIKQAQNPLKTTENEGATPEKNSVNGNGGKKRILFLGNSLTAGYGVKKNQAFPAIVGQILNQKGHKVETVNAGSSGSTSASGLSRLKWHLKKKPDILVLSLGANDGLRGVDLKSTKKNLAKVIELAQKKNIQVILSGMKLPLNYGKKYRSEFEKLYKELASSKEVGFIPFLLKNVGGRSDLNLPDGIHPNSKGHKVIAQTVVKYLEDYL